MLRCSRTNGTGPALYGTGGRAQLQLEPNTFVRGAPTEGAHEAGDIFVDAYTAWYRCIASGTPGTWVRVGYNPLTNPTRICDTRTSQGPPVNPLNVYNTGPLGPAEVRSVRVAGPIGPVGAQQTLVPFGASAALFNVAVTATTAAGFLTVWPVATPRPTAASINWAAGQTISNAVTVKVGEPGFESCRIYNSAGSTEVIIDLVGFTY